eukprot:scaffold2053_cov112-Cylindrotheca_fusiformis.AAC.13
MKQVLLAAISLNNRGVELLEKGQYKSAIRHFARGMQLTVMMRKVATTSSGDEGLTMTLDECMKRNSAILACVLPQRLSSSSGNSNSAYLHPISIPRHHPSPQEYLRIIPFIFFFNYSIAHHLMGISCRSKTYARKANKLYEWSLNAIAESDDLGATSTVYVCACLNNMASLYRLLAQHKESERCLRHLLHTLLLLTNGGCNSNSSNRWPPSFTIFFSSTASLIGSQSVAPAA